MLRAKGYTTACVGKWHVGLTFFDKDGQPIRSDGVEAVQRVDFSRRIEGGPVDHGFDRFFGTACCPTTDWLYAFIDGDRVPVPPAGKIDKTPLPKHPYANDCRAGVIAPNFPMEDIDLVFLKKSREFLDSHVRSASGKPFFLYHAAQAVHLPSFPADQFKGKTKAGPHGDFIHELDCVVGELLVTLDKLGVADNTLVIFTSDNGPETTSVVHMRADYGHDGARPWRGMKRDQWEGGHRVPFLVRWPGKVKPGTTSAQLTSLTDVMATVAAIIGAELPNDAAEDSFNMLPALLGKDGGPIRPYLLQQAFGGSRTLSIRRGNWKYLDHTGSGGNRYDNDPGLKSFILPDTAPGAWPTIQPRSRPRRDEKPLFRSTADRERTEDIARAIKGVRPEPARTPQQQSLKLTRLGAYETFTANNTMKDSFTIFRCTLTFLVAASFARPAQAAGTPAEENARLLAQIEPRIKAIYERDEFAIRSFHCHLAAGWLGLSEVGDARRRVRSGGRQLRLPPAANARSWWPVRNSSSPAAPSG